jgi:hypothetical protein
LSSEGVKNVRGYDSIDPAGVDADRCDPGLAPQQEVGLWSKRWHRAGFSNSDRSANYGAPVMNSFESRIVIGGYVMNTKAIKNIDPQNTAADKKLMEDLQKVISDAETALIEEGRLAVKVAGVYVYDNHWNWR